MGLKRMPPAARPPSSEGGAAVRGLSWLAYYGITSSLLEERPILCLSVTGRTHTHTHTQRGRGEGEREKREPCGTSRNQAGKSLGEYFSKHR
jgi:hypothetical protein